MTKTIKTAKTNPMIPLLDIQHQNKSVYKQLRAASDQVMKSGAFILGAETERFEKNFASYVSAPYAIGVGSGTDALVFGLIAAGVKPGDEVIVPSFTFMASALAIWHAGAIPVLCDVEYENYTLDPAALEKAITKKTSAVMVVHLFGQPADMDSIVKICRKHKLKIVEDACQAHGAAWRGKKAGMLGDAAGFSFYPTKNLGGLGDGGMFTTPHLNIYEKTLQLRNLGRRAMNVTSYEEIGWTSRLDSIQATMLNVKLAKLNTWNEARIKLAATYSKELKKTGLGLPVARTNAKHVYHLYVVRVPDGKRDALRQYLLDRNIRTGIYYEKGIHQQPLLAKYPYRILSMKTTERLSSEVLALPLYPGLKSGDQKYICKSIQEFFRDQA